MSSRDLHFKSVTLRNFLSYGNKPTTVNLDRSGTIQIQGRNLDDTLQGIGANGVGKSTIVNSIVYALYGEAISSDVKVDDVVNDINNKECVVSVEFSIDGDDYIINRYRKMKSGPEGNYIEIFKNGDNDKNLAKARADDTNNWIAQELLDMPKGLFTRLVVYDADEMSFFKLPAAKQRDLMENLFQLTILSEKANVIKDEQKTKKAEMAIEEASLETLKAQSEQYERQIEKAKTRIDEWEGQRTSDLDKYRSDFLELDEIDLAEQQEMFRAIGETEVAIAAIDTDIKDIKSNEQQIHQRKDSVLEKVQLQIENVKSCFVAKKQDLRAQLMDVENDINEEQARLEAQRSYAIELAKEAKQHQDKVDTLQTQIDGLEADIKKQQQQIATLNKNECPECHQQLPDATENIKKREAAIKEIKQQIHETNKLINEHEEKRDSLIDDSEQNNETYQTMLQNSKKQELVDKTTTLQEQLDSLKSEETVSIAGCEQSHAIVIEEIEKELEANNAKITELQQQQSELRGKIDTSKLVVKDESQLIRLQTEKDNLKKQIEDMEQLLNPHLEAMNDLTDNKPEDIDYDKLNEFKKLIDHQQFLIKALTDKRSFIRKKLISKRLPYLNERLSKYLTDMGLPYRVEFNSDLTPSISKRGRKKSFGVLSHGQKARVNFALSFAFRDVMERMHRRINLCLLDEVLDKALCPVGANAAVSLINEKARDDGICIFVITHKSELATKFKNHITVTLENGFSSVQMGQV